MKKLILLLIPFFFILSFVVADQLLVSCGGDSQITIGCLGSTSLNFFNSTYSGATIQINYPQSDYIVGLPVIFKITTNKISNCNYSLNGITNLTMNTLDGKIHSSQNSNLISKIYNVQYYCTDENNITTSNSKYFYVNIIKNTIGGGSGTTTNPSPPNETYLKKIKIISDNIIYQNKSNLLEIVAYDNQNQKINISNVSVYSLVFDLTNKEIRQVGTGDYFVIYNLQPTTLQTGKIYVRGVNKNVMIINSKTFAVEGNSNYITKTKVFLVNVPITKKYFILIIIISILIIIFGIYEILKWKRK